MGGFVRHRLVKVRLHLQNIRKISLAKKLCCPTDYTEVKANSILLVNTVNSHKNPVKIASKPSVSHFSNWNDCILLAKFKFRVHYCVSVTRQRTQHEPWCLICEQITLMNHFLVKIYSATVSLTEPWVIFLIFLVWN